MMTSSRGIYLLGNDTLTSMLIASLQSLASHNPSLPICFIPFSDQSNEAIAIARAFGCIIWEDYGVLATCDEISRSFFGDSRCGQFRKLAVWEGPFAEFIYMDIDTVILSELDFVFTFLREFDYIASHSNIPSIRRFVWAKEPTAYLTSDQIAYSANTGFFCSRKGPLSLEQFSHVAGRALQFKDYMELDCAEQPFLNSAVVMLLERYTSILQLKRTRRLRVPLEVWGLNLRLDSKGEIQELEYPSGILLVHWAGIWRQGEHRSSVVWNRYYTQGLRNLEQRGIRVHCQ